MRQKRVFSPLCLCCLHTVFICLCPCLEQPPDFHVKQPCLLLSDSPPSTDTRLYPQHRRAMKCTYSRCSLKKNSRHLHLLTVGEAKLGILIKEKTCLVKQVCEQLRCWSRMRISLAAVKVSVGVEEGSIIFLLVDELSMVLCELWWEESREGICRRSCGLQPS